MAVYSIFPGKSYAKMEVGSLNLNTPGKNFLNTSITLSTVIIRF